MAVDGIDENEIDDLLKLRMSAEAKERSFMSRFFTTAGTYAPAFGMVGTLIGLIQMLQNLTDPSQIGKGMAVALITTFYGALLANLIFLPFAAKMKAQTAQT
jgi:chemotaxis protein MotA